jgi:hypothetical protein
MLRTIIGSSNVYRFYKPDLFQGYKPFVMNNCSNQQVFDVAISDIKSSRGQVVISVIENILCDAVKGIVDPELMNAALETTINKYLKQLEKEAKENPEVKFAVVQPILRPLHPWYTENH